MLFVWFVLCVCNGDDMCVFVLVCMSVYIYYVSIAYFCACVCVYAHVIYTCVHAYFIKQI